MPFSRHDDGPHVVRSTMRRFADAGGIAVARDDFGERRLLIGGAHHADQPCRCGADAHDVEFDQLGLPPGTMTGQRDTPISSL